MKFKIDWCESKEGISKSSGKPYTMTTMTLVDETGKKYEKVTTFDVVQNGATIEGTIEQNGNYLNFKATKEEKKGNFAGSMQLKSKAIAEAQHNKAEQIRVAQDRSAWMWAKNNAVELLSKTGRVGEFSSAKELTEEIAELATDIYNLEPLRPF